MDFPIQMPKNLDLYSTYLVCKKNFAKGVKNLYQRRIFEWCYSKFIICRHADKITHLRGVLDSKLWLVELLWSEIRSIKWTLQIFALLIPPIPIFMDLIWDLQNFLSVKTWSIFEMLSTYPFWVLWFSSV